MAAAAAAVTSGSSSSAGDESKTGPLFDDMFDVLRVNPEGKKFEKGEHGPLVPAVARGRARRCPGIAGRKRSKSRWVLNSCPPPAACGAPARS